MESQYNMTGSSHGRRPRLVTVFERRARTAGCKKLRRKILHSARL